MADYKPFGSYTPDQPKYPMSGSSVCTNVFPITKKESQRGDPMISYGPFRIGVAFSDALTGRCQGAFSALESDNNTHIFAGDATDLYHIASGSTFDDVSRTSGGAYTTAVADNWRFAQFGDRVIATNYTDDMQSYILTSSTDFALLAASLPKPKHIAIVKDWLVVGNVNDPTDGLKPNRVHWSAIDDPTSFPTLGTAAAAAVQSDAQDLPSELGHVQGLVSGLGTSDAAVFLERGIYRMNYIGPPFIFSLQPAQGARGTAAPNSIVQQGSVAYYLGEDGFYVFDGTQTKAIGTERVDKTFFADMDQTYLERIVGVADPINKLIIWTYTSNNAIGGLADKALVYNWSIDEWSLLEQETQFIFRALGIGSTLEDLDAISTSLDALPFSLDSRVYQGNTPLLGGFDGDNKLIYFTGDVAAATVETNEFQFKSGRRSVITNVKPIVDATSGTPSVAISGRNAPTDTATFGTAVEMNSNGDCPQLNNNRYHVARLTLPAASAFSHLEGVEVEGVPEGER